MSICKFITPTKSLFTHITLFCLPQPAHMHSKQGKALKDEGRQRGDRVTNWGLDKSQHAKKWYFCSPWLCEGHELEFFYLEWGPLSQALPGRVSCRVCKHGAWEIGWLAAAAWLAGRKSLLYGCGSRSSSLWQHRPRHLDLVCWEHNQTGLTLPRGI